MSTAQTRPVRIHLAMKEDNPVLRAIRMVLPLVGNEQVFEYVKGQAEADLILFTEIPMIEEQFEWDKTYAYIEVDPGRRPILTDNCVTIDKFNILAGFLAVIDRVRKNLAPIDVAAVKTEPPVVPIRPDALRILVIEDTQRNIESAKSGLAGHRLMIATGYQTAMDVLQKEKFDVVLTDLHLPMSSQTLGGDAFKLGELVPYGVLLMIEAARNGARHVAVVTDLNHHADPFSAAFDHFSRFPVKIDGAKVVMMHAPMKDGAKDWATALNRLMKD